MTRSLQSSLITTVALMTVAGYPLIALVSTLIGVDSSTPSAIVFRATYAALSCLIIALSFRRICFSRLPVASISLAAFWILYSLRVVIDIDILGVHQGFARRGSGFFLIYGLLGCALPSLAIMTSRYSNVTYTYMRGLYLLLIVGCVGSTIYLYSEGTSFISLFSSRLSIGEEKVISAIVMSQYGGALAVVAMWRVGIGRGFPLLNMMAALTGVAMLAMGASRGPILSLIAVYLIMIVSSIRTKYLQASFIGKLLTGAGLLILIYALILRPNAADIALLARLSDTVQTGGGTQIRSEQWAAAVSQFLESPLWGHRIIERAHNFYPHNIVLEILMSTGFLGLLFLVPVMFRVIKRLSFSLHYTPLSINSYLLVLFVCYSMFSSALIMTVQLWVLIGLVCMSGTLVSRVGRGTLPTDRIHKYNLGTK